MDKKKQCAAIAKHVRTLCLTFLDVARPKKLTDLALLEKVRIVYPNIHMDELLRELDYLELKGLLTIAENHCRRELRLTGNGVDRVEEVAIGEELHPNLVKAKDRPIPSWMVCQCHAREAV